MEGHAKTRGMKFYSVQNLFEKISHKPSIECNVGYLKTWEGEAGGFLLV